MRVETLINALGADFYTGVPDSQLKAFCNYLIDTYGIDPLHHIIAANEGNCAALAAGYHLATSKVPVVYMQNSGEGNIINPVASLLNDQVYAIPVIFIIGWRGEPGIPDEPQHIYQGKVTIPLLEIMGISSYVVNKNTTEKELKQVMAENKCKLNAGQSVAFVIRKDALFYERIPDYSNSYNLTRENIINHILEVTGEDPIISTTGKAGRELFEAREKNHQKHEKDFLNVGSMGHASSIALGIAINKPNTKIWCIDGDGAALMHMGALAVIGSNKPSNMVHIVINNGAHETVGGMPTVASHMDLAKIATACGYPYAVCVDNINDFDRELSVAKSINSLTFIEIKCGLGARDNLGRPTITTLGNRNNFMNYLKKY